MLEECSAGKLAAPQGQEVTWQEMMQVMRAHKQSGQDIHEFARIELECLKQQSEPEVEGDVMAVEGFVATTNRGNVITVQEVQRRSDHHGHASNGG